MSSDKNSGAIVERETRAALYEGAILRVKKIEYGIIHFYIMTFQKKILYFVFLIHIFPFIIFYFGDHKHMTCRPVDNLSN